MKELRHLKYYPEKAPSNLKTIILPALEARAKGFCEICGEGPKGRIEGTLLKLHLFQEIRRNWLLKNLLAVCGQCIREHGPKEPVCYDSEKQMKLW